MTPTPNEFSINKALRDFLLDVLPTGTEVIRGQGNRTPPPKGQNYVVYWPLRRRRISTNKNTTADVRFTGSIAGNVMTVSAVGFGTIVLGSRLFGVSVADGTDILTQISGAAGGVGTYTVSVSQTLASQTLAAGGTDHLAPVEITLQLDVHGPLSGDNAQVITTLMRDAYGVDKMQESNVEVTPLYAEDPRQLVFANAEDQAEDRWIVEALIQANQVVRTPQQYMDAVVIELVEVDTTFPP